MLFISKTVGSSYCGPCPWLFLCKFFKAGCKLVSLPFQSHVRHFSCRALQFYNSPGDWARELFKPSTDSASLAVKIEKKNFSFWFWAFLGGTSQVGVFLRCFGHICLALGVVPMGHFLDSKFRWKLGQTPRL